ncbi:MAG: penicillin-binding protein activator LpoB [Thermodesulfobacteriota bacterium]|nr:penicillin-binding protein activator LpoB [Thermodesulfobacteriota bacterium]
MKRISTALMLCMVIPLFWGCATTPNVSYGDAQQVETVTEEFGSTDLQTIAEKMVNSLLATPILSSGQRPVVYIHRVKNKTDEHIDTKAITDKIRVTLLKSGRVRFSAVNEVNDEMIKQMEYQMSSGIVDPNTAKTFGHQIGADYFLYGEIISIKKSAGRVKDVYFKLTMNLVNIETGLIEWADEKEIRKQAKRTLFGQ